MPAEVVRQLPRVSYVVDRHESHGDTLQSIKRFNTKRMTINNEIMHRLDTAVSNTSHVCDPDHRRSKILVQNAQAEMLNEAERYLSKVKSMFGRKAGPKQTRATYMRRATVMVHEPPSDDDREMFED